MNDECIRSVRPEDGSPLLLTSVLLPDPKVVILVQARMALPFFCKIRAIEPGGWCFYDSVLEHLPQPLPCLLYTSPSPRDRG